MLGALPEERYALLVNLGKKITDFVSAGKDEETKEKDEIDDTYGVNVQFEDSDDAVSRWVTVRCTVSCCRANRTTA